MPVKRQPGVGSWDVPGRLVRVLAVAAMAALALGFVRDDPRPPDPGKVPSLEPVRLEYPDLESDAAFAGTWQLVENSGSGTDTKVGDRLVVEERIVDYGPDEGATVWDWHQQGPRPRVLTHWSQYVSWNPIRTPAKPWPIIQLNRGPSMRSLPVKAIYHLRGDLLWLSFKTPDGRLPDDFTTGDGRDVEVWRRVAPPVAKLEPESSLDGRWRLGSVEFHASGSFGPAAKASVPEHLVGTNGPSWFLKGKEGTVFEVEDGVWREEDRGGRNGNGPTWTVSRELRLPRRVYNRKMAEPRPAGVPAADLGTYRVSTGKLVLRFHQQWLSTHVDGVTYLDTGERIETYERPGVRPKPADR
jgi:hypothetical protein